MVLTGTILEQGVLFPDGRCHGLVSMEEGRKGRGREPGGGCYMAETVAWTRVVMEWREVARLVTWSDRIVSVLEVMLGNPTLVVDGHCPLEDPQSHLESPQGQKGARELLLLA